ncbi:MAG: hypothetical protein JXD21_08370 [Candidatus Omnitrophica bacterium]|nr:hypothetical protein [Candidatus Omnitrophota bacterium]
MSAEFQVHEVNKVGELLALPGELMRGKIAEGDIGSTWGGKRFKLLKIETKGGSLRQIEGNLKVTIIVRDILDEDVRPGDRVYIE